MFSELIKKHRLAIAFLGDIAIFCLSLISVLYIRYGNDGFVAQFSVHSTPFIAVLIIWLVIFYIANLYTYKAFSNTLEISRNLIVTILISFFVTITIFYIFSRFFDLTPKANLVIFSVVFLGLDIIWRYILRKIFIKKEYCRNVLMIASSHLAKSVKDDINENPHLGYTIYTLDSKNIDTIIDFIKKTSISLIVIDSQILKENTGFQKLYKITSKNLEIMMFADFYESIFRCIPLSEIGEDWFTREIIESKNIYETVKRVLEILIVIITVPLIIPLAIIVGFLVAITSSGPIIFRQERMGKNNQPFIFYKFRTMKIDCEGPLWTEENDARITSIGKILRHTHLDEIPQLWNVLKGDISFVGPRPERTKLAEIYSVIPHYEIRHIIKPGIVGWAQLNYKPSTSIEEAKKKFQYDLYYLKNRSLILDLFIMIKTVRMIFLRNR